MYPQQQNKVTRTDLILSLKRALGQEIFPQLRSAQIRYDEQFVYLYFFYDREITDDDYESMSCAETESSVDFMSYRFLTEYTRLDYESPIPLRGDVIYLRKEPFHPGQLTKEDIEYPNTPNLELSLEIRLRIKVVLAFLHALLGEITFNIREVIAYCDMDHITGYFYYDREISEEDHQIAESVMKEIHKKFPDYVCSAEAIRCDFPERTPSGKGEAIYVRREYPKTTNNMSFSQMEQYGKN